MGGYWRVEVGVTRSAGSSGNATGDTTIIGNLLGANEDDLLVGQASGDGDADGTLDVSGDVSGFERVIVGATESGSGGTASGDMTVGGALSANGSNALLSVGSVLGADSATGTLDIADGLNDFQFVLIGASNLSTTSLADGTLTIQNGGAVHSLGGFSNFSVGTNNGGASTLGTADVTGDVDGYWRVEVGVTRSAGSAGNATGDVTVVGNLVGANEDDLLVGQASGDGTADGTLDVSGDVSGFERVMVGATESGSGGTATGDMTVGGALSANGSNALLSVGSVLGADSATGTLDIADGLNDFQFVLIGASNLSTTSLADGTLTIQSGGAVHSLGGFSNFSVGTNNGGASTLGMADVTGNVEGYTRVEVGVTRSAGSAGNATGDVTLVGNLVGAGTDNLLVGQAGGDGTADGTLNVSGSISGFQGIFVGHTTENSSGNAVGELSVTGGTVMAANMTVGVSEGSGGASGTAGTVVFDQVLATVSDTLILGDGSTLRLSMDGIDRGMGYAAIDAGTALLGGALEVVFNFEPAAMMSFDLIVSGAADRDHGRLRHASNIMGL